MENENTQKELFEFDKPKKSFPGIARIFPKHDFALVVTSEKLVFAVIGMLMVVVVVYAIGVEQGRSSAIAAARQRQKLIIVKEPAAVAAPSAKLSAQEALASRQIVPSTGASTLATANVVKSYTIVAAAFSRSGNAALELNRLKKEGYEVFTRPRGTYSLICVGTFATGEEAAGTLKSIKRRYKDAYVIKFR